jgi:CheY-like chemotaxis protein
MSEKKKPFTILVADDDHDDREMTLEAFQESRLLNEIRFVQDGEQLMQYLRQQGEFSDPQKNPKPSLILLDLNMPRMDGRAALKLIKADEKLRRIPVVIMTTSKEEEDIFRSYDEGANSFITKPVKFSSLVDTVRALGRYWVEIVDLPGEA